VVIYRLPVGFTIVISFGLASKDAFGEERKAESLLVLSSRFTVWDRRRYSGPIHMAVIRCWANHVRTISSCSHP
jgi:hypothetical protein